MEYSSFVTSNYPPGLIELGGTILSQTFTVLIAGLHSYMTVASEEQKKALSKATPVVIENFLIAYLAHFSILELLSWHRGAGFLGASFSEVIKSKPGAMRAAKEFFVAVPIFELLFYFTHRVLHWPSMYRRIHATHHKFEEKYHHHESSLPLATFFVHPVEFILLYSFVLIAAALQRSHVMVLWSSGVAAASATMYLHSGKNIPGIMSHETHHQKRNYNFGALGLMDYIFGTLDRDSLGVKEH